MGPRKMKNGYNLRGAYKTINRNCKILFLRQNTKQNISSGQDLKNSGFMPIIFSKIMLIAFYTVTGSIQKISS